MKEKEKGEEGKDLVADVFSSLGHETRRRIVWELGGSDQPLSFSELMGAVGVEDTGTFGFHLKALSAIIQQEKDARYTLSPIGRVAYELVSLAKSSDLGIKGEGGVPRPSMIFEDRDI